MPPAGETADTISRAQRALTELEARTAAGDAATPTKPVAGRSARWNADDRAAQRAAADEHDLGRAM